MIGLGFKGTHFWRALLSVVVAYVVAAQSLLIAVAGFSLPPDAGQNARPSNYACTTHPARRNYRLASLTLPIARTASCALRDRMMR